MPHENLATIFFSHDPVKGPVAILEVSTQRKGRTHEVRPYAAVARSERASEPIVNLHVIDVRVVVLVRIGAGEIDR
jgi:hypothetical protein